MRKLVLPLAAWIALAACQPAASPGAPAPEQVDAMQVELTDEGIKNAEIRSVELLPKAFAPHLMTTATIAADPQHFAKVGSHMAGRVAGIAVRLGDSVHRGQALVEIDTVELHHVSTDYLTAVARAREADDGLLRQKQLVAERVGAIQDLRRAEAAAQMADAALREADEHLHFLGLNDQTIEKLRTGVSDGPMHSVLRAPITGRIEAMTVALGQVLNGTEDLLTIMQLDRVWATLRAYERDLAVVLPNALVDLTVTGYPERVFTGRIESISDIVDPATRTVEVRATVDNPNGVLKPGMSAVASVVLQSDPESLRLPLEAVQQHGGERVVFARSGAHTFTARKVTVGPERGGFVRVSSGVQQHDTVVVHGAFALRGELERSEIQDD